MSKIEWTHRPGTKSEVWNPVSGCSLESAGCSNCYAMHFAHRFSGPGAPFEGLTVKKNSGVKWNGVIRLNTDRLHIPLKWKTPRTCFVNSMSDLFHPDVPFDFIDNVFAVMDCCPDHTFIILTKRAERMAQYYAERRDWRVGQLKYAYRSDDADLSDWPLKNVWIGVSVEDQQTADLRINELMKIDAVVRFVSYEPALGPVDFSRWFGLYEWREGEWSLKVGTRWKDSPDWIIAGAESGNKARPAHPDWFRQVRDQCAAAGVSYFFKQWGAWAPGEFGRLYREESVTYTDGQTMVKVGKSKSGNTLDGVQHLNFPA
jgi:protein gp37